MTDDTISTPRHPHGPHFASRLGRRGMALAAGLLVLGGAAGAVITAGTQPSVTMAPATPVAIRTLSSDGIVTIRGRVAEVYGNKFVMADGTGRALVDTGPEGDGRPLVAAGQPVTVQGRYDDGFVHAAFLIGADRKVRALGPLGGPPHGPGGPHGRGGPGGPDRGPDQGPDRGPDQGPDRGPGAPPPPAAAPVADPAVTATVTPAPVAAPAPTPAPARPTAR